MQNIYKIKELLGKDSTNFKVEKFSEETNTIIYRIIKKYKTKEWTLDLFNFSNSEFELCSLRTLEGKECIFLKLNKTITKFSPSNPTLTDEKFKKIGQLIASYWGGVLVNYEYNSKADNYILYCNERGEEFYTTITPKEVEEHLKTI